jgi:hypothetical protein
MVLCVLEKAKTTTFSKVADQVVAALGQHEVGSASEQQTLRRRVYDVLNVFCAAGLVTKDSKAITLRPISAPPSMPSEATQPVRSRLAIKEATLIERAQLLIYNKLLIDRNRRRMRPPFAVQLPAIFVAFKDVGNGEIKRALDGGKLEIVANSAPLFFSPMNVFQLLQFGIQGQLECLRTMPKLAGLEAKLFPKVDGEEMPNRGP